MATNKQLLVASVHYKSHSILVPFLQEACKSHSILVPFLQEACVGKKSQGPFTLDTRTKFNVHWLHSHLNSVWGDVNWMCIEPIHLWKWIGTEFIVNNNKTMHSYAPINSNIIEAFTSRPPYTLYSPSKIRTMMAYHAETLLTRCSRKRDHLPSGLM